MTRQDAGNAVQDGLECHRAWAGMGRKREKRQEAGLLGGRLLRIAGEALRRRVSDRPVRAFAGALKEQKRIHVHVR